MKPQVKRALSLLLSSVLIIIALVIYATLIKPEYDTVLNLRGEFSSKSGILQSQGVAITQVQNLIARFRGVSGLGDTLSLALPQDNAVSQIMSQVNAISQASGMSIQSFGISYPPIRPAKGGASLTRNIGTLRLELKLFGSYSAINKFLQFLETNIRIMDVTELKIEGAAKSNQDIFNYLVSVDTYYQPK